MLIPSNLKMRLLLLVRSFVQLPLAKTEFTRLQRKVFWFEENEMKHGDYDQIKEKSRLLLQDKERVQRELKQMQTLQESVSHH